MVTIDAERSILVAEEPVDPRRLSAVIRDHRSRHAGRAVVVVADQSVPTGVLVSVMDRIRLAGVMDAVVATEAMQ